jgi:putative ABC transport system permease protein
MRVLRSIFRRKLRSVLTIFGITIGVLALIVMGSLAEKMTLLVEGGTEYYADKVIVTGGNDLAGLLGLTPLTIFKSADIEDVGGVAVAVPSVSVTLEEQMDAVNFGTPAMVVGEGFGGAEYEEFELNLAEGRFIEKGDEGVVLVGSDLVDQLEAELGGTIEVRGEDYEVVGILEKTLTGPDTTVQVSLEDAQRLFHSSLPEAVQESTEPLDLVTNFVTYPEEGVDPDDLAETLSEEFEDLSFLGPAGFEEQVTSQIAIFTSIVYAIALISLTVGGLSVVNTMTMSVAERTREIGVRKAIGASDGAIMRHFIAESAVMGLIGGLIGLGLGALFVQGWLASTTDPSAQIFLLTSRLAIGAVVFAVGLGTLSGIYPAWHAARLNPVQALRYE